MVDIMEKECFRKGPAIPKDFTKYVGNEMFKSVIKDKIKTLM